MTVEFQLQDFLGFPAIPNPADQLEKPGIPSFSWEFPMIFHRGGDHILGFILVACSIVLRKS
jgi:hypothetical protein